jgi:inositol 1,4,5-triphosphate receptor type 3
MKTFDNEDRLDITEMSIEMTHTILMTKGPEASEFNMDGKIFFGNCYTRFEYLMFNILFFIQDGTFIYYVLYFMISMLGFFYLDVFYALHLLDFITRSPTLQNVIKSVTLNGGQFLMTALLTATIIFIYTTIGFFYLQDFYIDTNVNKFEDNPSENFCTNMLQCYVKMLDAGLRNGGGIGDATLPIVYDNTETYFVKFAFDCTFHILVIIVMINILFGIIIDTFAQLRDLKQSIDIDMRNICYICSIDRNTVSSILHLYSLLVRQIQ